jgi:hypothetical protein
MTKQQAVAAESPAFCSVFQTFPDAFRIVNHNLALDPDCPEFGDRKGCQELNIQLSPQIAIHL